MSMEGGREGRRETFRSFSKSRRGDGRDGYGEANGVSISGGNLQSVMTGG